MWGVLNFRAVMWSQLLVSGIFMALMLGVGYYLGYGDGLRKGKREK